MPIKIFFCYAHEDEALLKKLKKHLRPLERQGLVDLWYDRAINAGTEWEREVDKHLNEAQIIFLLVSPGFMDSDYCYSVEMKRAMERHKRGEARVIPIILRPVHWREAPFGKLEALPTDGRPVKKWRNPDDAFFSVVEGIRDTVETLISEMAEQWTNKARAYHRDERYDEALAAYEKALEIDPDNHDARGGIRFIEAWMELDRLTKLTENEELERIRQVYGI